MAPALCALSAGQMPPSMHSTSPGTAAPLCHLYPLTFQHYDGEVLGCLGLAGGKALVGSRVALLCRGDEQSFVAEPSDGDGLTRQHQFSVAVPANGELWGAREGAGQDDCTPDARLQLLWCQCHMKRV